MKHALYKNITLDIYMLALYYGQFGLMSQAHVSFMDLDDESNKRLYLCLTYFHMDDAQSRPSTWTS